jgi:superoxide dismutase, Fe-Mn family
LNLFALPRVKFEILKPKPNQIMMTRRQAIKTTALASAALATLPGAIAQTNSTAPIVPPGYYPFMLPPLPYAYDALEPFIDAETMHIHHDKHHAAYVANLNKTVSEIQWGAEITIEYLLQHLSSFPENVRTAFRNNGGGHYNHSLFWQMMKKNGGGEQAGELVKAIETAFGSFSTFKDNFTKAALGQFGSGWAWLTVNDRVLKIEAAPNQDTPLSQPYGSHQVLLGVDVWEHAYYLKYQNKRADYIAAWWNVVNWDFVAERYAKFNQAAPKVEGMIQ